MIFFITLFYYVWLGWELIMFKSFYFATNILR